MIVEIGFPSNGFNVMVSARRILLLCVLFLAGVCVAAACNIPVFRYALERWKPDACQVIVFHDDALDEAAESALHRLESSQANLEIQRVQSHDIPDSDYAGVWDSLATEEASLPHVVLRTKIGRGQYVNHWHGSFDALKGFGLTESPVRQRICGRLLAGDSVVWLLVRSADNDRNQKAAKLVRDRFETLERQVQLPEGIGLPGSELYAEIPLVVKFSLLELDPEDPAEQYLATLLTGIRKQSFEQGEPLLVPIFGRGRALEVIPADDLSATLVDDLTVFLSGACSCQVKEQNPGFDLLLQADWDSELFGDEENRPPDRTDQEGLQRQPQYLTIPPGRK